MNEVAGIKLKQLEEPIRFALQTYEEQMGGYLSFDDEKAAKLELTPNKPNSARSATNVKLSEEVVGQLFVIAFKPEDGSGDEKTYNLSDLSVASPYPRNAKVVPRSKKGNHSEAHLTIVRHQIDNPHADPELFGGTFDLLGLDGKTIQKIGELGHVATVRFSDMSPLATLTVGWKAGKNGLRERFGDRHAVYSSLPDAVQVCAFLAITDEMYQRHSDILAHLNPQEPRQV